MTAEPRINCCVPFCRRTSRNPDGWAEWICGKHWSTTSKRVRAAYHRRKRRARQTRSEDDCRKAAALWERLRHQAMGALDV